MSAQTAEFPGMRARFDFAGRKFHAWWEGFAFDSATERAAIAAKYGAVQHAQSIANILSETIWGDGRREPGSPVWTMRFARLLSLPLKARVVVLGAGAGAPLNDLKSGTRWKVSGFTRFDDVSAKNLSNYELALTKIQRKSADGAISFFELGADADGSAIAALSGELVQPGANIVFIEFVGARRGVRLRSCFPARGNNSVYNDAEIEQVLREAGFSVADKSDETAAFMNLVAAGWAGWRRAYMTISHLEDTMQRAAFARAMAKDAHIWAERFDAMKSGQLRVVAFRAIKKSD